MALYKIYAYVYGSPKGLGTESVYLEVEADSEDDAEYLALDIIENEWLPDGEGSIDIESIEKIKDKEVI